jgi:hypothetical protein
MRLIENDRDALRLYGNGLEARAEVIVSEGDRLRPVARSKTQEVDDLRAELARLRDAFRSSNREFRWTRGRLGGGER